MKLIQTTLTIFLLLFLLVVAWPLFVGMFVLVIGYWLWFMIRVRKVTQNAMNEFKEAERFEQTIRTNDIIDVEYTEKEEPR